MAESIRKDPAACSKPLVCQLSGRATDDESIAWRRPSHAHRAVQLYVYVTQLFSLAYISSSAGAQIARHTKLFSSLILVVVLLPAAAAVVLVVVAVVVVTSRTSKENFVRCVVHAEIIKRSHFAPLGHGWPTITEWI